MMEITDRVTVLRNGRHVGTLDTKGCHHWRGLSIWTGGANVPAAHSKESHPAVAVRSKRWFDVERVRPGPVTERLPEKNPGPFGYVLRNREPKFNFTGSTLRNVTETRRVKTVSRSGGTVRGSVRGNP